MKQLLFTTLFLYSALVSAQFGPVTIIDDTASSGGIKKIVTGDLNNDGFKDVVVAQAYNIDNVSYYLNNGEGGFSEKVVIDSDIDDPVYVTIADFNNDNWQDVATITQNNGEVFVYLNNNGIFSGKTTVDTDILFGNALVSADFDDNGWNDIVAIGQHSIDYYRNVGGTFTKEHILTTDTSPNILECMYIEVADMNNDNHPDIVTSETLGGVIYFNNGNGIFTPQVFTTEGFISRALHVFDANNDGFKDIAVHLTPGPLNLYLNNGTGTMTFHSTIFNDNALIKSIEAVDMDNNGFLDIYTAFENKARAYLNSGTATFAPETIVHEDEAIFINEVAIDDLDNDGISEYIWSGVNNTIAYQKNTTLSNESFKSNTISIYPNPGADKITIVIDSNFDGNIIFYTLLGQQVINTNSTTIDVSELTKGIYVVEVSNKNTNAKNTSKFIKE